MNKFLKSVNIQQFLIQDLSNAHWMIHDTFPPPVCSCPPIYLLPILPHNDPTHHYQQKTRNMENVTILINPFNTEKFLKLFLLISLRKTNSI